MTHTFTPYAPDGWDGLTLESDDYPVRAVIEVSDHDHEYVTMSRGPGYHGTITDLDTKLRWRVYGAACSLPNCFCAARIRPEKGRP